MPHSKIPPVPPASRSPNDSAATPPHAPREQSPNARAAGPAEKDNIHHNVTNTGMQQNR